MRLTAIHKSSVKAIEILGVHEISEKDGIYYIAGGHDPGSMTMGSLTVMYGGDILFKARKIELDDKAYYSIELSK